MRNINLIFIGFLLITSSLFSQEVVEQKKETKEEKRAHYTTAIMIVPQIAAVNGMRIDFEFRTGKNAIVIAPTYYSKINYDDYYDYKKMNGAGLDLAYKFNLINPNKVFVPYAAANLSYDYFSVDAINNIYEYYDEFGNYSPNYDLTKVGIHKVGLDALMGFQITPIPRFVIDFCIGVGTRHSFAESEKDLVKENFSEEILDMAYSGIIPTCNFKIGIKL
ncbi:MAG: hypothetical protein IPO21_01120 [Bacteroidales bacterium]|nr:hypothetical protein [Bacteroidales bacterium]